MKSSLAPRWLSCVIGLFLLGLASQVSAQTLLRWKFAPDQQFTVDGTQLTEVTTIVSGKAQKAYLEMAMQLAWRVDGVDADGVATLTQSFTRLAIKTIAPQAEPISFDSAAVAKPTGPAKELAASILPLIGAKFTVQMDARGDVKSVKLTEEAQKALTALPEDSQLKQLLSPAGLTQLFKLGGGTLPEAAVKADETWTSETETLTPYGTLKQTTKYTYVGEEPRDGRALHNLMLVTTGQLTPASDSKLNIDVKEQTKTGSVRIDIDAGYVVEAESKLLSKSVKPFRDNTIQVTIESTNKLLLKRE